MRPPCQPSLHRRRFKGGVVVYDDVDVEPVRDIPVDHLEEVDELPAPLAAIALAADRAGGDVERREQQVLAVALVVMGTPLSDALQHLSLLPLNFVT